MVAQHERQPPVGQFGVQRHVRGAGLGNRIQRDHHLDAALQAQCHGGAGVGAAGDQVVGEPVGARVEFAVAESLVLADQRVTDGGSGGLFLERPGQSAVADAGPPVGVQCAGEPVPLPRIDQVKVVDRPRVILGECVQHPQIQAGDAPDGALVEQAHRVFEGTFEPLG